MSARFHCTVFAHEKVFDCPFDHGLGFFCGRCKALLGHTPKLGQVCKCGARVEEVVYPTKRTPGPRPGPRQPDTVSSSRPRTSPRPLRRVV